MSKIDLLTRASWDLDSSVELPGLLQNKKEKI